MNPQLLYVFIYVLALSGCCTEKWFKHLYIYFYVCLVLFIHLTICLRWGWHLKLWSQRFLFQVEDTSYWLQHQHSWSKVNQIKLSICLLHLYLYTEIPQMLTDGREGRGERAAAAGYKRSIWTTSTKQWHLAEKVRHYNPAFITNFTSCIYTQTGNTRMWSPLYGSGSWEFYLN